MKLVLTIIASLLLLQVNAQDSLQHKKNSRQLAVKESIEKKNFTFSPNSMMPLRGKFILLSYGYFFTLKNDSLIVYLPYYGEAHLAPPDPNTNSLNFTSTDFSINITQKKSDRWNIEIYPKDQKDPSTFTFTVFDNGTTYLDVKNNYRDPISYQGSITAAE